MDFEAIFKTVVGLDVHPAQITACAIWADADDAPRHRFQTFGATQAEIRKLAAWVAQFRPELVVMESTGVYWKSVYRELEEKSIRMAVVNARHIKNVPGRKTDMADSQWLAMLGRAGLLRGSFVSPADLDALRLISRHRQKLVGILAGEKNRFHKVLADAGVRLSCVVSDLHGQAARRMSLRLIEGASPEEALALAGTRLKASKKELREALEGKLTAAHRFVLAEILAHIVELEERIALFNSELLHGLASYQWALDILQTIPGVDMIGAAMIVVEMGVDMEVFGDADRLASWAGVCPGNNESAGKRKNGRTRKGNRWLRGLLCEAAQAAVRTPCLFKVKFQSLALRRGRKRAIMAVAHKILKTIFVLLKRKESYRDSSVNYEELLVKRRAPRWIAALTRYNLLPKTA
jgi:transposase